MTRLEYGAQISVLLLVIWGGDDISAQAPNVVIATRFKKKDLDDS